MKNKKGFDYPNQKNPEDRNSVRVNLWVTEKMHDEIMIYGILKGLDSENKAVKQIISERIDLVKETEGYKTAEKLYMAIKEFRQKYEQ